MSNQYLSFDVTKQSEPQQLITGRQGDSQLKFVTMLFWDGDKNVPYDLTGKQVVFEALKPDKTHIVDYEGITVLDAPAGLVRYSFNEQVFSVSGTMQQAFFKITHTDSDNNVISDSTLEVAINILENRVEFGINSKDYLSEYDNLIAQVKKKFDDYAATVQDSINNAQTLHNQIVEYTNLINSKGVILSSDFGDMSSFKQPLGQTFVDKLNNEFNDRGVNVTWYGAKGDGVTDDTNAINTAAALGRPIIFEPGKNYSVKNLTLPEGTLIEGNNATLSVNLNNVNPTLGILSGTNIRNLKINCLTEDLEWSRIDFKNKSNIELDNLTISGFRHKSDAPNAWGIYLDHSSNIRIKNCKFDNNSQSDIAIVEGCSDILIDNCSGLNDTFYIDVEPNSAKDDVANIVINQCDLSKLSLLNPTITKPMGTQISVNNSHVKLLDYGGIDVSFNDSKIDAVNPYFLPGSNNVSGGTIKLNGALGLSANLITDPHMQSYATVPGATSKWIGMQGTMNASGGTTRFEDENGSLTMIGTRSDTPGEMILNPEMRYKDKSYQNQKYPVVEGDTFMLTLAGKADYPTGSTWPSMNALFYFYDATDKVISNIAVSLLKAEIGGALIMVLGQLLLKCRLVRSK